MDMDGDAVKRILYWLVIAPTKGRTGEVIIHLFCPKQLASYLEWAEVDCEWKKLRSGDSLTTAYGSGQMKVKIHRH